MKLYINSRIRGVIAILLCSVLTLGCGSTLDPQVPVANAPTGPTTVDEAFAQDPGPGLELVPVDHLNPISQPQANDQTIISVAELESDYETIFLSLNDALGVTAESPENVENIAFIKSQDATGNFDLAEQPILNNGLGITGVSFQPLEYDTTVPLPNGPQKFHVSGGLLMPVGIAADEVKGVVVYFHGTTFNKSQVGSNYDKSPETQLNAQVFASQGYIVAIPDYVGQGVDWQSVHPYVLYPEVSAQTAVDMLSAIRPLIVGEFGFTPAELPLKLFSAGYSEGGSYSLWFNSYLSENPQLLDPAYVLTHSVAMEGAYSTSQVIYDYLFNDVSKKGGNEFNIQNLSLTNFVKPILSADAFLSYATYSLNSEFNLVFNPDFFNMVATPPIPQEALNVEGEQVDIASAFARPDTQVAPQLALAGLGKTNNGSTYPGLLGILFDSSNSIVPFVSPVILTQVAQQELLLVLAEADANLTSVADDGVSLITLDQDSVVPPNNFDILLDAFPSKIRNAIKIDHTQLQVVSPYSAVLGSAQWVAIDHLNGPAYEFLYALNIFNQF